MQDFQIARPFFVGVCSFRVRALLPLFNLFLFRQKKYDLSILMKEDFQQQALFTEVRLSPEHSTTEKTVNSYMYKRLNTLT